MIRGSKIHQKEQEEVENPFQFTTNNITSSSDVNTPRDVIHYRDK
jgi:hypothetical protein